MNIPERKARNLLEEMGGLRTARTAPIKKLITRLEDLEHWIDDANEPTGNNLLLFRQISRALENGETLTIVPDTDGADEAEAEPRKTRSRRKTVVLESNGHTHQHDEGGGVALAEPPPEQGEDTPKRRGRPRKGEEPPVPVYTFAVEHRAPSYREIEKPRLVKVTRALAERFYRMTTFPKDRDRKPYLLAYIREKIRAGHFRGTEWASALCKEDDKVYRLNGKHTSEVIYKMYEAGEEVPEIYVIVREYEGDTMEDLAFLFTTFDPRQSARSKRDIIRSFSAGNPVAASLSPRLLNLVTAGVSFNIYEVQYRRMQASDQAYLMLQQTEFMEWFSGLVAGKKPKEIRHILRVPVVAAMVRTWEKDPADATQFWTMIRDDSDLPRANVVRRLYKYLVESRIGAVADKKAMVGDREMFVICLNAWNRWRADPNDSDQLTYFAKKPTPQAE